MRSITTWTFEPGEPLALASGFSDREGTVLLYSGGKLDSAESSFLCLFPEEKIVLSAEKGCWEQLEKALGTFDSPLPIPKWVGYLGYEMGCFADDDIQTPYFHPETPDACFYRPSVIIHFDHLTGKAELWAKDELSLEVKHILSGTDLKLVLERKRCPSKPKNFCGRVLGYRSDTLQNYIDKIAQAKEWILDGEIYQVNLSQEYRLDGKCDPFHLFQKVSDLNPAPFSAYIKSSDFSIVSSSPERFISRRGGLLETRPIKGTTPRGATPEEDDANRNALVSSEKERAELLMITDLMRNDLGKVSDPGSVKTEEIWRCEGYTNVFHLLSIIKGRSKMSPVSLVKRLFPAGSVTGCPKLHAMKAIAELEKRPRGVYTGSIGYFAANGDFDFNVAIRTLVVHPRHVQIQLGGAIVIDSDPIKEYEETLHKGKTLFKALEADELCLL